MFCLLTAFSGAAMADGGAGDEMSDTAEVSPVAPPQEDRAWDHWVGVAIYRSGNWLGEWGLPIWLDTVVLRPMGAAATLCGMGAFLVSLPISVPTFTIEESWETFVANPGTYTFTRPLGRF